MCVDSAGRQQVESGAAAQDRAGQVSSEGNGEDEARQTSKAGARNARNGHCGLGSAAEGDASRLRSAARECWQRRPVA